MAAVCDAERLDGRQASINERRLRSAQRRCARHVGDVAVACVASYGGVEVGRRYAASEDSALERTSSVVGNVQDGFVHDRLYVQSGTGEEKLFMRLERRVDSGIDRWLAIFQTQMRTAAKRDGHSYVSGLMCDDACSESGRKVAPEAIGCSMIGRI